MGQQAIAAPWVFEILGPGVWLVMAAYYIRDCRRQRGLTVPALVFLGATTMWWQEWYGDWAAYLLYSPRLHLIPGYELPLTSGNKPWAVIPAYGWFFGLIYFPIIAVIRKAYDRFAYRREPSPLVGEATGGGSGTVLAPDRTPAPTRTLRRYAPSFTVTLLVVGVQIHYLWDLIIEGTATQWGLWTYVYTFGPAIVGSRGSFPLLYPVIPFALFMTAVMYLIDKKRPDGTPAVEAWARADTLTGARRTAARVATWVLTMNLTYWFLFIGPIVLIRLVFLPDNALVP